MKTLNVGPEWLKTLRAERAKRDHAAHGIGVATVEFERMKANMLNVIDKSQEQEQYYANEIFKQFGIGVIGRDLTINQETGEVLELINGRWVALVEGAA